jgi:hypothetical protein
VKFEFVFSFKDLSTHRSVTILHFMNSLRRSACFGELRTHSKFDRRVKNSLQSLSELFQIRFQRGKEHTDFDSTGHDRNFLSIDWESFMEAGGISLERRPAALILLFLNRLGWQLFSSYFSTVTSCWMSVSECIWASSDVAGMCIRGEGGSTSKSKRCQNFRTFNRRSISALIASISIGLCAEWLNHNHLIRQNSLRVIGIPWKQIWKSKTRVRLLLESNLF